MKRLWILGPALLVLLLAGGAACNDDDDSNETADRKTLEEMEEAIDLFIGTPACDDGKDCNALAFGAKPCGGPWSYKIFALTSVDSTTLAAMIDEYNTYNAELNEKYGWMSDCMYVSEPHLDCLDGVCRAIAPADGSTR